MTPDDIAATDTGGDDNVVPRLFRSWLAVTRSLQVEAYGSDPVALEGEERADFVRWNVLAAIDELMETLAEVRWKPWAGHQGEWKDRDAFVDEIVDVLHFVGNLLVAAGADDLELDDRYGQKVDLNRARRAEGDEGYDAIKASETETQDMTTKNPLIRVRGKVSFGVPDGMIPSGVATVMRNAGPPNPSTTVHSIDVVGRTVIVDLDYTAHGADGLQLRRRAAEHAQSVGAHVHEHKVLFAGKTTHETLPCAEDDGCPSPMPETTGV